MEIETRLDNLEADRVALLLLISALMKTHQDKSRMHLTLTSILEQQMGDHGAMGQTLSPLQKERVRYVIEWLGGLN